MSKDWYLMKSPHSQISGYEEENLNNGFNELFDSEFSQEVELYNSDLVEHKVLKVIIQNNTADTDTSSITRTMLSPIGFCNAGMYIKYKDKFWLITGLVDNNQIYEKSLLTMCNYLLSWVNPDKEVVQRYSYISSTSQSNNSLGEQNGTFYTVNNDQLSIKIPYDKDGLNIRSGTRFIIDSRIKQYENSLKNVSKFDNSKQLYTYETTRIDTVSYDYQSSGILKIIVKQGEQHDADGYYVVDDKGFWLCEKPKSSNKTNILSAEIIYDSLEIYNGLDAGIFTSKFFDSDGNEISIVPSWKINCKFLSDLNIDYVDNSISISVDNKRLNNKHFDLTLSAIGYNDITIRITIRPFI